MAKAPTKGKKTETLSLRLDPKIKFILDYTVRVTGMSITGAVERAIQAYAAQMGDKAPSWEDIWDVSEGVRTLRMLATPGVPTTFEDDDLIRFVSRHWVYFYHKAPQHQAQNEWPLVIEYVDALWPKIHEYIELWRKSDKSEYGSKVAQMMTDDLSESGLNPPDWPGVTEPLPF